MHCVVIAKGTQESVCFCCFFVQQTWLMLHCLHLYLFNQERPKNGVAQVQWILSRSFPLCLQFQWSVPETPTRLRNLALSHWRKNRKRRENLKMVPHPLWAFQGKTHWIIHLYDQHYSITFRSNELDQIAVVLFKYIFTKVKKEATVYTAGKPCFFIFVPSVSHRQTHLHGFCFSVLKVG